MKNDEPIFITPYGEANRRNSVEYITENHIACVLLLDTSGSMLGPGIDQLNRGLQTFKDSLVNNVSLDKIDKDTIDVAIVSFGKEVSLIQDFMPITKIDMPVLQASGPTPFGAGLNMALDLVVQRKNLYRELHTSYNRPWIFCITDGEPNDEFSTAVRRLKEMEEKRGVVGYCIGVDGFDEKAMVQIFGERTFVYSGLDWAPMFEFLSCSIVAGKTSIPGTTEVTIEQPPNMHTTTLLI